MLHIYIYIYDISRLRVKCGMGRKVFVTQEKQLVTAYHKTNMLRLQNFLRDKLPTLANNGSSAEEMWKIFKEGIYRFVPHKILKPNPNSEYYNKKLKRLNVKS